MSEEKPEEEVVVAVESEEEPDPVEEKIVSQQELKEVKEDVESEGDDTRQPLWKKFEMSYTYLMVGGVIINVATLLFTHMSVSAAMKTSTCPRDFDFCQPEVIDPGNLTDACLNPADEAIFVPGSDALDRLANYSVTIGLQCFQSNGGDPCIIAGVINTLGVSPKCGLCYPGFTTCAQADCARVCFLDADSPECSLCLEDSGCNEGLRNCTGIEFPSKVDRRALNEVSEDFRFLQDNNAEDECFDKESITIFQPINLTFVSAIQKALSGGSFYLGLLVLVASGIWPYIKNVLILSTWFIPMTQSSRDIILRVLAILGKWSLVDVFTVILIVDGANLQKILGQSGIPLLVFAESRIGIYTFCIAALWALCQGEWVRYLEKRHLRQSHQHLEKMVPSGEQVQSLRIYRAILGFTVAIAFVLAILGMLTPNLTFEVGGRIANAPGRNEFQLTTIEIATNLISDCALYSGHGSPAGAHFLAGIFLLVCVIFPLLSMGLMYYVSLTFHHSKAHAWLVGFAFGLSNFAALDVYFLSMFTFAKQFDGLIAASVGDGINEQCGVTPEDVANGIQCLTLSGNPDIGALLIAGAAFMFWIAQFAAAELMQKTYRFTGPVQKFEE